jgi:hypothetical protein
MHANSSMLQGLGILDLKKILLRAPYCMKQLGLHLEEAGTR